MGPSYSECNSSITGVATNGRFLIIELGAAYQAEVNDSRIDEIYQKIDDYCKQQEGITHIPVVFIWGENISLPEYGPQIFEEAKKQPGFIITRGTMPVITDPVKKTEWEETMKKCIHNFRNELQSYMKPSSGPLTGYGYNYRGYVIVSFDTAFVESVNNSLIDEIYLIIDGQCKKEGVTGVPVVFEWREEVNETEALYIPSPDEDLICMINEDGKATSVHKNETYIDKDGNYVIMSNNTTQNPEKANQTPGFTLIIGILGFLSFLFIKHS